jgi:hypothetical protein
MNSYVKSGFLNKIFLPSGNLLIDYDFRSPSYQSISVANVDGLGTTGTTYLFFNAQVDSGLQYSGSKIYNSGKPALSYGDASFLPSKQIISGRFDGKSKYRILGNATGEDWTFYIAFKPLDTGTSNIGQVLLSNKVSDSSLSGFAFGINGCNRLFYEFNVSANERRIFTLDQEIDNKNLVSISKVDQDLAISIHQFEDLNSFSSESHFPLSGYNKSNSFFLGGMGVSGIRYKNFSGYVDQFMYMDKGLAFPERNAFSEAFFCSGYDTGVYETYTETYPIVTGAEYQNVLIGTGVTGYVEVIVGTETVGNRQVDIYGYSGVTGFIYEEVLVELTGYEIGSTFVTRYREPSGLIDYNYLLSFSNSRILSFNNFDDSYKEVYSFSGKNSEDINLIANFLPDTNKFSIMSTGSGEAVNFYVNGLAAPYVTSFSTSYTGDFTVSGVYVDSEGFYDANDIAIYDLIAGSGSITGLTTAEVTAGTKLLPSSFVNNRDIYLNGDKLISGINYSGVGANISIKTSDLIDGDIMLLPKHGMNLIIYTGYNDNNFNTNLSLFEEQVWINGLRQVKYIDYEKVPDFSLKYTSFSLDPFTDIVYNNDTGFFNV